jgi:predicted HicB family RNase H-like nuclease
VGEVEVYLNPFEERVSEEETEGTIYARIPASLKRKIEEAAKAEGLSANSWAMRCFERCLSQ